MEAYMYPIVLAEHRVYRYPTDVPPIYGAAGALYVCTTFQHQD